MTEAHEGIRIARGAAAGRASILTRRALDEIELSPEATARLESLFGAGSTPVRAVDRIVEEVRLHGDAGLREWTQRLDGYEPFPVEVGRREIQAAYDQVTPEIVQALSAAVKRIREFHERGRRETWLDFDRGGLGQLIRPLDRIAAYVPGGTAAYPSTVLMTVIPARIAGVRQAVVLTPANRSGVVPPVTLVAADLADATAVYRVGGAQAIAAAAYGTESLPRVDKIVGPGNLYVTLAKRRVFGAVGIDGLHGPTETLLIADDSADPDWCAADLIAQAEHDVLASAVLITPSEDLAGEVRDALSERLGRLPRGAVAAESLVRNGGIVVVDSLDEAFELANEYAPEHLCLLVWDAWQYISKVRNAGGVFVGEWAAEAYGDYVAGPSHVMPTGGTARFASPLSTNDFVKITSIFGAARSTIAEVGESAARLAEAEGLKGHAEAVIARLKAL